MFKLDDNLLQELGLGSLPPAEKNRILGLILEKLEERVGMNLASKMSEGQLDEFEKLMPAEGDSAEIVQQKERQALTWLETNFPNYKQVVGDELEKLKAEIKQAAPQIVASAQQQAAAAPNSAPAPMPPQSGPPQGQDPHPQLPPEQPPQAA